jgi:uncharacterized membrane protein YGL010W
MFKIWYHDRRKQQTHAIFVPVFLKAFTDTVILSHFFIEMVQIMSLTYIFKLNIVALLLLCMTLCNAKVGK